MTNTESQTEVLSQHTAEELEVLKIVGDNILRQYQDRPAGDIYLEQPDVGLRAMALKIPEFGWNKVLEHKLPSTDKVGYEQIELVAAYKGMIEVTRRLTVDDLGDTHFEVSFKSEDPEFNREDGKEERLKRLMKGELRSIHTSTEFCEVQTFDHDETVLYAPKADFNIA